MNSATRSSTGALRLHRSSAFRRGPAAASADQIDRGAQLQQRVVGWIDSVHARDGVEDRPFLLVRVVSGNGSQSNGAQIQQGPILGPLLGGIVDVVAVIRQLQYDAQLDRSLGDFFFELIEQKVRALGRGGGIAQ